MCCGRGHRYRLAGSRWCGQRRCGLFLLTDTRLVDVLSATIFVKGFMLVIHPGLLSSVPVVAPFWCLCDTTRTIGSIVFLCFSQGSFSASSICGRMTRMYLRLFCDFLGAVYFISKLTIRRRWTCQTDQRLFCSLTP